MCVWAIILIAVTGLWAVRYFSILRPRIKIAITQVPLSENRLISDIFREVNCDRFLELIDWPKIKFKSASIQNSELIPVAYATSDMGFDGSGFDVPCVGHNQSVNDPVLALKNHIVNIGICDVGLTCQSHGVVRYLKIAGEHKKRCLEHVLGWIRTVVFERECIRREMWLTKTIECKVPRSESIVSIVQPDPRADRCNHLFSPCVGNSPSEVVLHTRQRGIDEEQDRRSLSPKKYFLPLGCAVFLTGCVLLSKILDKVYLNSRFNVDMAVGVFFFAGLLVCIGGGIILWVLFV